MDQGARRWVDANQLYQQYSDVDYWVMSKDTQTKFGYEKDLITDLDTKRIDCECTICLGIVRYPMAIECGHIFCYSCLKSCFRTSKKKCPTCKKGVTHKPNLVLCLKTYVETLMTKCEKSCGWTGKIEHYHKHELGCVYGLIECTDCKKYLPEKEMEKHKKSECSHRKITCPLMCGEQIFFTESYNHQLKCSNRQVFCYACQTALMLKDYVKHRDSTCYYRTVKCPDCKDNFCYAERELHKSYCPVVCQLCDAKFPTIYEKKIHILVCDNLPVTCKYCFMNCKKKYYDDVHKQSCNERPIKCTVCNHNVRFSVFENHQTSCQPQKMCRHCYEMYNMIEFENHEQSCIFRCIRCPTCLEQFQFVIYEKHIASCQKVSNTKCIYCFENFLTEKELKSHVNLSCDKKLIDCPKCDIIINRQGKVNHLRFDCEKNFTKCHLCNKKLLFKEKHQHWADCPELATYYPKT
jgi:hypothetical protein